MDGERRARDYVVVGAGAIGGTLAFHLARAGHRVLAVDADAAHVAAIRARGITIVRGGRSESVAVDAATPEDAAVDGAARVLLCVKGVGATERAAAWIAPRLAEDGVVVSMQNGLQVAQIAERVGAARTVAAFVDFFADVMEPGVIVDGGAGTLRIGETDGRETSRVRAIVADLQAWGPARATGNIYGYLWSKLGFSAMLTATALADAPMADLIDRHRDVMLALTTEVYAVARAHAVSLEAFDGFEPGLLTGDGAAQDAGIDRLVAWLRRQTKTRSGVWRDIAVHRRATEAVGRYVEVIEAARAVDAPSAHLEALVELLRELEGGRRDMAESNFRELRRRAATAPLAR